MKDSFLEQVARAVLDKIGWQQLRNTTFVLPSHRAGLVLKDAILRCQQERHAQAVWAPQVQTLTQLQDYLSPLYAEDELFTIVRLYRLFKSTDFISLDLFYGWGRQMVADFTNVDASMPAEEVPNFFENTIAAHELEQWNLDEETEQRLKALMNGLTDEQVNGERNSVKEQYNALWQQLYTLYRDLKAEMAAEQKGFAGMRQRAVLEHWEEEEIQNKIAGRTYVFVGFNYLLPVERDLMLRLRDAGQAFFFWDYVPNFETNEKAFSFAQLNHALLGGENLKPTANSQQPIALIECVSREAQAQYVHRWLQENYAEQGQKVGVVICDETMLEPVIYTLPAITLDPEKGPEPINITKGFPLRNTAVYARVLRWLNDWKRGNAEDIVNPAIIDELLTELFPVAETTEPIEPEETSLSWKELLILESEYQVRKIANQMRALITSGLGDIPFTLKLLRLLMRRTMENVTMPFHGEPITDMQIMGVLETRLMDFDKLLLLNVEEGVLPQKTADISFIPYYLRKAYHMQTPDERATVYAYNFFRLLSRTNEATILYASAETAEGGKGMSRFVMQMLYSPAFEIRRMNLQEADIIAALPDDTDTPQTSLLSTLRVENGWIKRQDGRRYRMSPSALNTYIACPRSFYLQYVLGLQAKEEEDVLFAPNTMGSFVHHCMEYIYRTYLHCDGSEPVRVTPEAIEAVRTDEMKMQEALAAAYRTMNEEAETPYIPEHHVGENVIILGYVSNILERDRKDAQTGLQICGLELDCNFAVQLDGIGEMLTGGKIDRLDIYGAPGQEVMRVVDYKTGGYNDTTHAKRMSANWDEMMVSEEKSYVRQTLVYSNAVLSIKHPKMPIEPHLFFCRRKLTDIVTTIDVEAQTVQDFAAIQQPFEQALQTKMREVITATSFPMCAEDDCPTFCPFFTLCGRNKDL